ncbi:uncharacterized protein [Channa argus]|uniref:uncharacterized protein isoform X3 n=1 Tax=Channa argus TaxID=215402 RepID=UPI003520A4FD
MMRQQLHRKVERVCEFSSMDQCEDREEGDPPSKTTLCGEPESQTKAQRPEKLHRPDTAGPGSEPEPSCVSMKSDGSMEAPLHFRQSTDGIPEKLHRPDSAGPGPGPEPICVSAKSNKGLADFKTQPSATTRISVRPDSAYCGPEPSCVSLKSDWSNEHHIDFKGHQASDGKSRIDGGPDSADSGPGPRCVSMKSDQSKHGFIDFKGQQPSDRKRCPRL